MSRIDSSLSRLVQYTFLGWVLLYLTQQLVLGQQLAQPQYLLAIAIDATGQLYLGDRNLPGVWRLNDQKLVLFYEGSRRFRTPLNALRCLAVDRSGKLVAGDSSTRQIYRFDDQGQPQPLAKPWDAEHHLGPLGIPMGIVQNSQGELIISDLEFRCLWKLPGEGGEPQKWVEIEAPTGLAIDTADRIWVVSRVENPLRRVDRQGNVEVVVAGRPFEFPHSVALDDKDNAYVVDGYRRTIWRIPPGAPPEEWLQHERFVNPVDVKRHGDHLWVVDPRAKAVFRIGWDKTVEVIDVSRTAP